MAHEQGKCPGVDPMHVDAPMIEPLELAGNEAVADMVDNVFARSGFNGRRLAEACHLYRRMLHQNTTIALTVAGAMTPIGMSGPIISLIKAGFVDFLISFNNDFPCFRIKLRTIHTVRNRKNNKHNTGGYDSICGFFFFSVHLKPYQITP